MWGALTLYGPHWICPSSRWRVLPGFTLLRLQGAVQEHCPKWALHFLHFPGLSHSGSRVLCKGTYSVECAFCALPRSEQLRWPGSWQVHCPRWTTCLNHLPGPGLWFPGCTARAPSQLYCISPLGSSSQTVTLLADINHPGSQGNVVSNWDPAHSLVEDASLCGWDCSSPLPSSSGCRMNSVLSQLFTFLFHPHKRLFSSSLLLCHGTSHVALVVKNLLSNAGDIRNAGLIPGSGRFPGEGNGNPLQYSCLENPMERGAWRAIVHRVTKSWTRLKQLNTAHLHIWSYWYFSK